MMNRLASENSPYLLQHKENPVDWYPWATEALERAKQEDKPIFLSIGYAACHWCHVMEHESFENETTADMMNQHFINIKVDREERPDLDGIYMDAVVALTGQGGWPMSVFLTPDGEPFFGGTYFPPEPRYGMPSFQDVLHHVITLWDDRRDDVLQAGEQLSQRLRTANQFPQGSGELTQADVDKAAENLANSYDWKHGGWGQAPKFPQPMAIEFLLLQANRGNVKSLQAAKHALKAMAQGGMYDLVGGGFARYSVDSEWRVPHFEKMLYDNAQLARVYLHAYLETRDEYFKGICEQTLDFVARELRDERGGFYSSIDADSEGVEGKFYLWDTDEINEILTDPDERALIESHLEIKPDGNFEGRHILRWKDVKTAASTDSGKWDRIFEKLYFQRSSRIWPSIDDKVLVSWNALMMISFAEAARYLKRNDYLEIARSNAEFLLDELFEDGRLLRSWRRGRAKHNAYLEDHAALILGLLSLYQSDSDPAWYQAALRLAAEMDQHFADPSGGFFDTRAGQSDLLLRPKELQDNATPSGNSLAAFALLQLSAFEGKYELKQKALTLIQSIQDILISHPIAVGKWLCALSFGLAHGQEIAVIGLPSDPQTTALVDILWGHHRPYVVAIAAAAADPDIPLLANRSTIDGKAAAYVCRGLVCKQPTTSPGEFSQLLASE
ncbi:MAG: thioredoxin domain-containing protein [Anaerolineae bacterium]|nr:thioredoxin domain-containing protein [Anaerolineae bacterium]